MFILAADTSCDDSCVSIIDTTTRKILGEVVLSHIQAMQRFGGIVPEIASREHLKALPLALEECLKLAGLSLAQMDGFAVTHRPGLIGALLVGVSFIKSLAFRFQKPLYMLNHIEAHLYSPLLGEAPPFPWLALVVSGGHTELFHVKDGGDFRHLGGTLDDAAGEAFDKTGKLLGFPYPAGPLMDKTAREYKEPLPKNPFPIAKVDGFDFSFSGLKTAVSLYVQKNPPGTELEKAKQIAWAQEAILDQLVLKCNQALEAYPDCRLVITGGVACNSRLREKMPQAYFPLPKHCTDNASMVAVLAALKGQKGQLVPAELNATAHASGEF